MIDWYMLFTPLVVLPIMLLFAFVGCTSDWIGEADPTGLYSKKMTLVVTLQGGFQGGPLPPMVTSVKFEWLIDSETLGQKSSDHESAATLVNGQFLVNPIQEVVWSHETVMCQPTVRVVDGPNALELLRPKQSTIDESGDHWVFELVPPQAPGDSYQLHDVT
jgi:hypothetical protein